MHGASLWALFAVLAVAATAATAAGTAGIYSCVDGAGKRLTSDRPIPECNGREQRVLNPDGSLNRILPPTLTVDEGERAAAIEQQRIQDRARIQEAIKRDRNLLNRFPDETAHRKGREKALDDLRRAVKVSEDRLVSLGRDRKPLVDESEFYTGKALPAKLQRALDANDALTDATRSLLQNQRLEIVRIDKVYDEELERLRRLWKGAQPGSVSIVAASPASAPQK
jgi:hypothetical protein